MCTGHSVYEQPCTYNDFYSGYRNIAWIQIDENGYTKFTWPVIWVSANDNWMVYASSTDWAIGCAYKGTDNYDLYKFDVNLVFDDESYSNDNNQFMMAGYPDTVRYLYGSICSPSDIEMKDTLISHRINSSGGQSGAPVFIQTGNRVFIYGVHSGGEKPKNYASKFTEKTLKWAIKRLPVEHFIESKWKNKKFYAIQ